MKIWDPIRALYVEATPEEKVRQTWILRMVGSLGYPKGLLSVEKEIAFQRRVDLLCYTPHPEGLEPLLVVEFKAASDFLPAEAQAWGYNDTASAPFVCVICGEKAKTFWKESQGIVAVPFLPPYEQLTRALRFRK